MMKLRQPVRRQGGLAMVEAAIALPFLMFVMLAATEFSFAFIQHTTLTKAARDGARYLAEEAIDGSLTMNLTPALIDEARRLVVYGDRNQAGGQPLVEGLVLADVSVLDAGGNNIEVRVDYAYSGILGSALPSFGYGDDVSLLFNMTASVTMRAL